MSRLIDMRQALLGPARRRYAVVATLGNFATAAVAFGGAILAARLLGAEGKGEYTAWTLASTTGALLVAGSAPTGFGRAYLAGYRSGLTKLALRQAALTAPFLVLALPMALLLGLDWLRVVCCVVVGVPAALFTLDLLIVLQAAKRARDFQSVRLAQATVVTLGFVLIVAFGPSDSLSWAFAVWAAALVGSALVAAHLARRSESATPAGRLPLTPGRVREMGVGSYGARLIDWLGLRADQFILVALAGPTSLGIYSVAVNFSEIGMYFGQALGDSVFEDERTLNRPSVRRIFRRTAILLTLVAVALAGLGVVLIGPIFGAAFLDSRLLLLLLLPGIVARGVGYAATQILLARGDGAAVTRILLRTSAVGLSVASIATLLFGAEGTAGASSVLYVLQMVLTTRRLRVGS